MNFGVRVIKRGRGDGPKCPPVRVEQTEQQRERELASTVKGWISEWEQGRRLDAQSQMNALFGRHPAAGKDIAEPSEVGLAGPPCSNSPAAASLIATAHLFSAA